jgi:hypothetical protein
MQIALCAAGSLAGYSITASARATKAGGISSPAAFAVLTKVDHQLKGSRLLDRRSAGLAPFRIMST